MGVHIVPLSLDDVVLPSVVVVVNSCSALASPPGKVKFGPGPDKHKADERRALKQANQMFACLSKLVQGGKTFIFLHPHCSILWESSACIRFLQTISVQAEQCGSQGELWVVHNVPALCLPDCLCVSGFKFSWEAVVWCGAQVASLVKDPSPSFVPSEFDAKRLWVQRSLANSTKALASEGISSFICEDVCNMLFQMKRGCEMEHLRLLYRVTDSRGSDVRLNSGAILDGVRQLAPYPAFAWDWTSVQSYPWVTPQHINVLELLAFSTT